MTPIGEAKARSSVELIDSCNCNECCPRACCFPRRVVRHKKPVHENPIVDPQAITRTHNVSMPVLTQSGAWEVEIDGVKHGLSENPIGQSIVKEHGGHE